MSSVPASHYKRPVVRHLQQVKNAIVSDETKLRRVWFGAGRGGYVPINLRNQFRWLFGLYEIELRDFVRASVGRGDVSFDVGAAEGYYAVCLARLSKPNGVVYAFEPETQAFRLLSEAARANHRFSRIEALNVAVGRSVDLDGKVVSIDQLVFDRGVRRPQFLKIDVEGSELDVLHGARRLLAESRPRLLVEVHSRELEDQCLSLLQAWGYTIRLVDQSRWLPDYRPGPHNRWICAQG
jgi:precorrin-6B methylase 2